MYNTNIPTQVVLPSTGKLIKSTVIAAVTAGVLLVTVVMPAEYGIDPTGVGNAVGLKKMGEIKISLAEEAATDSATALAKPSLAAGNAKETAMLPTKEAVLIISEASEAQPEVVAPAENIRTDEMQVTPAPNEGTEIKVALAKGKKVEYSWSTDGGRANFDVQADSEALGIKYHGYGKGSEQKKEGIIEAAFDGNHGWFWRNRTADTITLALKTSGEYTSIKRMK